MLMLNHEVTFIAGQGWMNWCMFGAVVACVPVLLLYRQQLQRFNVDTGTEEPLDRQSNSRTSYQHPKYGT